MVKPRGVYDNDGRNLHTKHCRHCNCSVGNLSWVSHLASRSHEVNARYGQRTTNVPPQPRFHLDGPATINDQFKSFKSQVMMKNEDCDRIQTEIIRDLKPIFQEIFGYCEIKIIGSMLTGLALVGSDIDLAVATDNCRSSERRFPTRSQMQERVGLCVEALDSNNKFANVNPIINAKIPIISLLHMSTRTKCDLSFSGFLGKEHGSLLRYYFNLHPRFLEVMQLIKFWAKMRKICDGRDYISSYGWNLMFIVYLQSIKFVNGTSAVPSVFEMQQCSLFRQFQGCRVDFRPRYDFPLHDETISHLWILNGFFKFYETFSFDHYVLCPYLGIPVLRYGNDGASSSQLSPNILQHMNDLRKNLNEDVMSAAFLRIIQDPFNHKGFVACRRFNLRVVTANIARAARLCEEALKEPPSAQTRFLENLIYY